MCGLFWGAHKSLAPSARTLLGGLGQATLSFFAVATLLFVFFGECPKFCDLAKQRRKIVWGVSEVGKNDFSLYFFWRCVIFLVFYFSSAAIARRASGGAPPTMFCRYCRVLCRFAFLLMRPPSRIERFWQRNSRSTSASKIMNSRTFGFLQW